MPSGIYVRTNPSWNKGLEMLPEWGEIRRHSFLGRQHTQEAKNKVSLANKGHPITKEMRLKMSEMAKLRIGENGNNWKGGITKETKRGRGNKRYNEWRLAVFSRDNFQCIWCQSLENIEADHRKRWSEYPELRYEVNNGRTLCHRCHNKTRGQSGR